MDIEDATWQDHLKVLQLMYEKGELSNESAVKIREMLDGMVDEELSKPTEVINNEFVDKCVDLMGVLAGVDKLNYASHKRQNWRAIKKLIRKQSPIPLRRIFSAIGLVVVLIIGIVVADLALPIGQVVTYSTPDEQLYIVEGKETRPILVPSAMASLGADEDLSIQTTNLDEIDAFFGFKPPMPQTFPTGWKIAEYEGHISQIKWTFMLILFSDTQDYHTSYQITVNTTYDDVRAAYHQNEVGSIIELPNGFSGYLSSNMEDTFITWQDGLTSYDISGPISTDEALVMVDSII